MEARAEPYRRDNMMTVVKYSLMFARRWVIRIDKIDLKELDGSDMLSVDMLYFCYGYLNETRCSAHAS
jgi:hypothetical protein